MLCVCFEVFGPIHRARLLQLVKALLQSAQLPRPPGRHVHHRLVADRLAFLRQVADHRPFIAFDRARIRFIRFQNNGKQRRFAGAVRANQRDALAVVYGQGRVLEERAAADGFAEIPDGKHKREGADATWGRSVPQATRSISTRRSPGCHVRQDMKYLAWCMIILSVAVLTACDGSKNGRYIPVSAASGIFLVDTQTGRMYNLPPQYREGTEPKKDVPTKWKLVAEF